MPMRIEFGSFRAQPSWEQRVIAASTVPSMDVFRRTGPTLVAYRTERGFLLAAIVGAVPLLFDQDVHLLP